MTTTTGAVRRSPLTRLYAIAAERVNTTFAWIVVPAIVLLRTGTHEGTSGVAATSDREGG